MYVTDDPAYWGPEQGMDAARECYDGMLKHQASGKLVVIACDEIHNSGDPIIRVEAGVAYLKRRATFEEYAENSATPIQPHQHARFYWVIGFIPTLP